MENSPAYRSAKKKQLTPKTKKPRKLRGFFYVPPSRYLTVDVSSSAGAYAPTPKQ